MEKRIVVVVKGIIKFKNKLLIVKRSDNDDVCPGEWEFPGGKIDFGERPEDALIREIGEEVGLAIKIEGILYTWTTMLNKYKQYIGLNYFCISESDHVTISFEHSDYKWVDEKEIKEYIKDEDILNKLRKIDLDNNKI
ncbi:NUDIX domain-containing protein [uncultured Clostridium sp.]|uniref:NUDIX hydrolase n=1 Tax=uncultured Clostridium sp. TaxID=59620 RepID=UPI0028E7BE74|nr:NUDIX domain-containing protein [uncultured Clostridium sp.]